MRDPREIVSQLKPPRRPRATAERRTSEEHMKVLITGAAGFIGSNLAAKLARRGDTVVGIDNYNDYYNAAKKRANAERVTAAYPNCTIRDLDVRQREAIV